MKRNELSVLKYLLLVHVTYILNACFTYWLGSLLHIIFNLVQQQLIDYEYFRYWKDNHQPITAMLDAFRVYQIR